MNVGTVPKKPVVGVKMSWPEALSATLPLATATEAPPAVMAVPATAVMVRPAFSKLSFVRTLIVTAVFNAVVTLSLATSTTGVTDMLIVSVSVKVPSVVTNVKTALPLKSAVLVKVRPSSAALICAAVPTILTEAVPLVVMVAPPPVVTLSVPLVTLTVAVRLALSTSATLTPPIGMGVSSKLLCATGTVLTGASLTAVTLKVKVLGAASNAPAESCTENVKFVYGAPLALSAGAKLTLPAAMSAALMICPAVTVSPFSRRVPLAGTLSIRTLAKLCPASGSVKVKFAVASASGVSSGVESVWLALSGSVLEPMNTVSVALEVPPLPSLIV